MAKKSKNKFRLTGSRVVIAGIAAVLVLALMILSINLLARQILPKSPGTTPLASPLASSSPGPGSGSQDQGGSTSPLPAPSPSPAASSTPASAAPKKPTLTVNSLTAKRNDSMLSTIFNTTPGATCQVKATGSQSVVVASNISIDSSGQNASIPWKVSMGAGAWDLTAICSLNGQSASSDALHLMVSP